MRIGRAVAAVAVASAIMACAGGDGAVDAETVSSAELEPGDRVPVADDPILAVDGDLLGDRVVLDLESIEALTVMEATVFEPFLDRDVTFRGVWLSDLLAIAQASPDATELRLHALDDYQVVLAIEDIEVGDALLATRADGATIPVDEGGPTRLVFLDDDGPGANDDLWIWNLDVLTVD